MSQKINPARFFILGFSGLYLEKDFIKLIEKNPPAGFLMLGNNYQNLNQLKNIIKEIKTIAGENILLAVDQEPGRVQRFKTGFPQSHLPQHYVSDSNIESFRIWCRQTAELMAELGLNFNLGPVVDLCSFQKDYPVLTGRSFGGDIEIVNKFSNIFINEFKKYKILSCIKAFPRSWLGSQ